MSNRIRVVVIQRTRRPHLSPGGLREISRLTGESTTATKSDHAATRESIQMMRIPAPIPGRAYFAEAVRRYRQLTDTTLITSRRTLTAATKDGPSAGQPSGIATPILRL